MSCLLAGLPFACYEIYTFFLVVYLFISPFLLFLWSTTGNWVLVRGFGIWDFFIVSIVFVSCEVSCNSQLWLFHHLHSFFLPFPSYRSFPAVCCFLFSKNSQLCCCLSG